MIFLYHRIGAECMSDSFDFKNILNILLIPFIVLISLYVIGLLIYCITQKKKNNPRYIYNINFNLYVIGIMIGTFCLSLSLVYFIYKAKADRVFDYKSFGYSVLFFLGLVVMFVMFVRATRKDEKEEIKDHEKNKELKLMVNEIKATKIEKKPKKTKKEQKEEVVVKEEPKVEVLTETPKKNNKKTKVKENDKTIEIEILKETAKKSSKKTKVKENDETIEIEIL
jgi:Ca2+/Na+ antiporter